MGIPSYFSYIIKNYGHIIRNLVDISFKPFTHLFMDCNSIIYDAVRSLEMEDGLLFEGNMHEKLEKKIIENVVEHISEYIFYIKPTDLVYIAFDGVAPFAKMEQQRIRRHKNQPTNSSKWSTSNITPGTNFMKKLSQKITKSFKNLESHFHVNQIIVSSTLEPGEGEHKLFQYIREHQTIMKEKRAAIYGLDSDLIMLALFHFHYFSDLYIFRETPAFGAQLIEQSGDDTCNFLSIQHLAKGILSEMNVSNDSSKIYDYIFMCFFLGNDFLPHFPSLNIRTTGMETLIQTYSRLFRNSHEGLVMNNQLNWKQIYRFIYELAKYEHERISGEMNVREKWVKRNWSMETDSDKDFVKQSAPVLLRGAELYIDPSEKYWQNRYYSSLFEGKTHRKDICINYLEGLEWVFKYYTNNCPHWKWKYHYHYPPLLKDLINHVPRNNMDFIMSQSKDNVPYSGLTQLCYVLPKTLHTLLPEKHRNYLQENMNQCFVNEFEYQWAFCRYLWEAHPLLPSISIDSLNKIECL